MAAISMDQIRVLHVDDDPEFTDLTGAILEREDDQFTVETANSADNALERIDNRPPDCIVSDYNMPGRDGLELLEAVREADSDLPFILFTGKGSEEVASEAISVGVTDYLQKRGGTEQYELLANRIRNAVGARREAKRADMQEQLMRLTEFAGDTGGFELDTETGEVLLTDGARRILNISEQADPTHREGLQHYHPDDRDGIQQCIERALQTGEQTRGTWRYHHPDGEQQLLDVTYVPTTADGDTTTIRGAIRDVTDHRERQEELRLLRQAIDEATVPITLADPSREDEPLVYVNDAFEEVTGYAPEETLGRNCRFLQGEETDPEKTDALREAIDSEEEISVELRNYRKDGTEFWNQLTVTPIHDDQGELVRYLGTQRDVTERKRTNEQVGRLHDATRELFDADSPERAAEVASDAAADILGLPLNGIHFYESAINGLAPVAVSDASRELLGEVPVIDDGIAYEAFQRGEFLLYNDVRETSDVYNPETPVRSEMFLPLGDYGVFIISSRQVDAFDDTNVELARTLAANTEAALERISREQELVRKNDRLDEFASIVSHDLRSPLTVADGSLELAQETDRSDHFDRAADAINRSKALVDDLLTLAREGEAVEKVEPVRLADVAESSWQTVETGRATIEADAPQAIRADRSRLQQLLENLYRNAVEHGSTNPDPRVQQGAIENGSTSPDSRAQQGTVEHGSTTDRTRSNDSVQGDGNGVTVTVGVLNDGFYVADTGPGIPESERGQVFNAGYSTAEDGTGFGLRIVEQVVEAHGWEITATESEHGGARFEVTGVEFVDR